MTVALVATREAAFDQGVQRAPERLASDVEAALQLDEARTATLGDQRKRGCRPAVMKELDQFVG